LIRLDLACVMGPAFIGTSWLVSILNIGK